MSLTPQSLYQQELHDGSILPDPAQKFAVQRLQQLYQLLQEDSSFIARKFGKALGLSKRVEGLYIWGSVGVGKTYLMDLFYSCLPEGNKLRLHYNHFIARIHDELKQESGHADPLEIIGRRLAKHIRVLCLDELYITDIGDGMVVYNLFKALFEQGVVVVITSNFPVDKLYKDELQPKLFEPAIDLIKNNTRYLRLDGKRDYRLLQEHPEQTYFLRKEKDFNSLFDQLNLQREFIEDDLSVCGRPLEVVKYSNDIAWFTFEALCIGPRSKLDYIELADRFASILISEIPALGGNGQDIQSAAGTEDVCADNHTSSERKKVFGPMDNAARRFMTLVDELYDRHVNLYLSADVPLDSLYVGRALAFEFERTRSRLTEMQTIEYLKKV